MEGRRAPTPDIVGSQRFRQRLRVNSNQRKNEVAFRPFGIDVPDELANACQAVRNSFTNEQKQLEKAQNPLFLKPSWKETTAVGRALAALKHDTDVTKIEALAKLTEEESARLARLKEDQLPFRTPI